MASFIAVYLTRAFYPFHAVQRRDCLRTRVLAIDPDSMALKKTRKCGREHLNITFEFSCVTNQARSLFITLPRSAPCVRLLRSPLAGAP